MSEENISLAKPYNQYGISEVENRFCEEYLIDLDQKAAAIRSGVSPKSASVWANRAINKVGVSCRIADLMVERAQRTGFIADQVLREISEIGLSNLMNYSIDDEGYVTLAEGADDAAMRAVKAITRKVKYDKDGNKVIETEIQLWDKIAALKMMAKHLGMMADIHLVAGKVEHQHKQVWNFGGREIEF